MNIIRTYVFFDRDLNAGHVTSFSKWLACWSVRVVALFYGRESTELVSIWYVFQFYLALYLHVLHFYFSFHRSSLKKSVLIPNIREKFYWNCMFSSVIDGCFEEIELWLRHWSWIARLFDSVTCGFNSERYFFTFILRKCFHSHWALRGKAMAIIFVPVPRRLLALNFWNRIWKGTHGTSGVRQCSGQVLASK